MAPSNLCCPGSLKSWKKVYGLIKVVAGQIKRELIIMICIGCSSGQIFQLPSVKQDWSLPCLIGALCSESVILELKECFTFIGSQLNWYQ